MEELTVRNLKKRIIILKKLIAFCNCELFPIYGIHLNELLIEAETSLNEAKSMCCIRDKRNNIFDD